MLGFFVLCALLTYALVGCGEGHRVNPGAPVAVYEGTSYEFLEGQDGSTKPVAATFDPRWPQVIHVSGFISRGDGQFTHEVIHMLISRLEAQGDHIGARIVNNAFRDLCSDAFELGHDDLMIREIQ